MYTSDYINIFSKYAVSEEDIIRYTRLIDTGAVDQAMGEFCEKYVVDPVSAYTAAMQGYMRSAETREIETHEKNSMFLTIASLTTGLGILLNKNFKEFITPYAKGHFDRFDIQSGKVRQAVLDATMNEFETLTKNSLNGSHSNVVEMIRKMQKEIVIEMHKVEAIGLTDHEKEAELSKFRKSLMKKYPELSKAVEEGQIFKVVNAQTGKVTTYRLDRFMDMSTTSTLLNIERNTTEIVVRIDNDGFVEFFLRDKRHVKTKEREICRHILAKRIEGKALLATDDAWGKRLGVMTIDEARTTPDYAMGPYCRHSIRPVAMTFKKKMYALYDNDGGAA